MNGPFQGDRARRLRARLLAWHDANQRDLPWRRTRDPYRILVSEVMLQQTRVAVVIPYYERFVRLFPTAAALARAREATVLRAWAGLGYYSRARNLQSAAKEIARHGFPQTYEAAIEHPGVGAYTAAAVMSIAFGHPHAAVDGNVRRVLTRIHADEAAGQSHADTLLDRGRPGDFNQAMMELGATVCLPRNPQCGACPITRFCRARRQRQVDRFPARKIKRSQEFLRIRWAFVQRGGAVFMRPPEDTGLWRGFWTLPELAIRSPRLLAKIQHTVTFRRIEIEVYTGSMARVPAGLKLVPLVKLDSIPLATPVRKFLKTLSARGPSAVRYGA
jgi:A/G-specific adenine glycosylase